MTKLGALVGVAITALTVVANAQEQQSNRESERLDDAQTRRLLPAYGATPVGGPADGHAPMYGSHDSGPAPAFALEMPPDLPESDPMVPASVTMLGIAGASMIGGLVWRGQASDGGGAELCGIDGCFERPSHGGRIAGAAMFGGGLSLGLLAGPVALATGFSDYDAPRQSEPMAMAGFVTTSVGVTLLGSSIAALAERTQRPIGSGDNEGITTASATMIGVGVAALSVGIPIWAYGGRDWRGEQAENDHDAPVMRHIGDGHYQPMQMVTVDNNSTMKYWGIGVTVTGLTVSGVGLAVGLSGASSSNVGAAFSGLIMLGTGGLMLLPGIPLWIAGEVDVDVPADDPRAVEKRRDEREARIEAPKVSIGAGTLQMDWRF